MGNSRSSRWKFAVCPDYTSEGHDSGCTFVLVEEQCSWLSAFLPLMKKVFRSMTITQGRQVSEGPDARQKEVSPAPYGCESR